MENDHRTIPPEMKNYNLLTIFLVSLSTWVHAQHNCDEILDRTIITTNLTPEKIDSLTIDFSQVLTCGLDSTAFEIATSSLGFGLFIAQKQYATPDQKLTYRDFFNFINEMTTTPEYQELVKIHLTTKELKQRLVNLEEWSEDSKLLKMVSLEDGTLNTFYDYLRKNKIYSISYFDAWVNYRNQQIKDKKNDFAASKKSFYVEDSIGRNIDRVFELAKKIDKHILFYFTGWTSIKARKLEYELFKDQWASEINEKYLFIPIYIDDTEPIPIDATRGKWDRLFAKDVSSFGKKNRNIRKHYLSENGDVPSFAIVDGNGKLIRALEANIDKENFYQFLNITIPEN